LARECRHPDARWLVSLFPAHEVAVSSARMAEVMRAQGEHPLAMILASEFSEEW
jgi:hypothetical protein